MSLHTLFATCGRGIEPLLSAELSTLGASSVKERNGGVTFEGDLATAYRACLWSRLASRVLLPLSTFPLTGTDSLYAAAQAITWRELFDLQKTFAIEVAGRSPHVTHTQFAGLKVKDAIADRFRADTGKRPDVDTDNPDIRVHLHLGGEQATLSLDLSGAALHERRYRRAGGEAPLKENLAVAILTRSGWPTLLETGAPLLDPMCGSGTLVIEAALMAADIAPGLNRRRFGFECWRGHDHTAWQALLAEAAARRDAGLAALDARFFGQDLDARALEAARHNAQRAGVGTAIQWSQQDAVAAEPPAGPPGLLVCNPPYGERLGNDSELIKLYSLFGENLRQRFGGWHVAIFTSREDLTPRLGLRASRINALYNGAIACKLLQFDLAPAAAQAPVTGGEAFANRLRKNLRHLSKWARRNGVTNYRVYDADLPEYALAVDLYDCGEPHAHVQEYAAPKSVDPAKAEKHLRQALHHLQKELDIPAARIHYKLRKAQKGSAQYEKQQERGRFHEIVEHGCKLRVNFDSYLDTGLFLDHRPLRQRLQQEARGKRFLNLFCYTGSASVHAARGGAAATVSVDLSNTYLDWARENFWINGFKAELFERPPPALTHLPAHSLIRADCTQWLADQASAPRPPQFDLIFLDPPTFSNSKKMEDVFDVKRDHVTLLGHCLRLLAPGGSLYFSSNRRGFKLDASALANASVQDITAQTLAEDFRRPPPAHRCWLIRGT
jgi:23S rRNA (guanine2445-N2)-methyltransferase / 23S rRNA (guanine2069-N7)-methyltransferase